MAAPSRYVRFGPFIADRRRGELRRDGRQVVLTRLTADVLLALLNRPGEFVSKEELLERVWKTVEVADSSLFRVMHQLRRVLGKLPNGDEPIENQKTVGYRFIADVEYLDDLPGDPPPTSRRQVTPEQARDQAADREPSVTAIQRHLDDWHTIALGRAALESLHLDQIAAGLAHFTTALAADDRMPGAHSGLAMASFLRYESTRADLRPDRESLVVAEQHAVIGCQQDPESGEAWSTLALVRHRLGLTADALAASRTAVRLEPGEWRHWIRRAFVNGGAERLRAAARALRMAPHNAFAHWLIATVLIARGAFDEAITHLAAGAALQDLQRPHAGHPGTLTAVGLHLLHGQVLMALGDLAGARRALERELSFAESGHYLAREVCANTWYALGVIAWREGSANDARRAFERALAQVPGFAPAAISLSRGLGRREGQDRLEGQDGAEGSFLAIMVRAIAWSYADRRADAARLCLKALQTPNVLDLTVAWSLPVEPTLAATQHLDDWSTTLACLHHLAN